MANLCTLHILVRLPWVHTHYKFASEVLVAQKHVFVEKPIAAFAKEAKALIALSEEQERKLMVGHTFIYTSAVRKMKEIIDSGELGDIYYINSQRLNLGLFQQDINVLWDLAPHDISIVLYLLDQEPQTVSAVGASHINPSIEDVAVLTMRFSDPRERSGFMTRELKSQSTTIHMTSFTIHISTKTS